MDTTIIENHNKIVLNTDTVIHVGDFCWHDSFELYRHKLRGNIIFIAGNHEDLDDNYPYIERLYMYIQGKHIHLVHNPENYDLGVLNLTAHVHQAWVYNRFKLYNSIVECINVGVDRWGFQPISFDQIINFHKLMINKLGNKVNQYTE